VPLLTGVLTVEFSGWIPGNGKSRASKKERSPRGRLTADAVVSLQYRKYTQFVAGSRPQWICEGKTSGH